MLPRTRALFLATAISMLLSACGGGGGGKTQEIGVTPGNNAPVYGDMGPFSLIEGSTEVVTLSVSDPDGDAVTLSIGSGGDSALFSISGTTLSFIDAPDYENPSDANGDNTYQVTIAANDTKATSTTTFEVSVLNALEGRVVDGPIAGANIFIDANCNGSQDDGEPSATTDADGNYWLDDFDAGTVVECTVRVIAKGGTDSATGVEVASLTLVAALEAGATGDLHVTPLSTLLADSTAAEAQALLAALGIAATASDILATDYWAASVSGDAEAQAIQRVNQQIGLILETLATLADDGDAATDQGLAVAAALSDSINALVAQGAGLDLTNGDAIASILTDAVAAANPDKVIGVAELAAVGDVLESVLSVSSNVDLSPVSDAVSSVAGRVQDELQGLVGSLISGDLSVAEFAAQTGTEALLGAIEFPDSLPDEDDDGLWNAIDQDDDGDGISDLLDRFPLISIGDYDDTDGDGAPDD
ncbi:MAG: hypothetical protein VW873_06780, partial [Betaproteobacteria bacterium]